MLLLGNVSVCVHVSLCRPITLSEYNKTKPVGYYELGKLPADLNTDELILKRANKGISYLILSYLATSSLLL